MKKIIVFIICLFAVNVNAQLLDSLALSKEKMYKSLKETNTIHSDSVLRLSLQWKKIKNLGEELSRFKNLQELHLKGMRLKNIPMDIFDLTNLVILEISNCRISVVPVEIGKLVNLTHLNLSQNYLVELPASFQFLKKLEYLDIWSNSIVAFPAEISALKNTLRIVDMRVIYMNDLRKEELQALLPYTTFYFSQSCNCNY